MSTENECIGKRVLVTGGAVRVGRAITLALAEAGCEVCVHYGQSVASAREVKQQVEEMGGRVELIGADLSEPDAVPAIVDHAVGTLGGIDVLVNSAAIFLEGNMAETTAEMWDAQFAINLRAPFFLCQAFAQQFQAESGGHIINIVDARLNQPAADHAAYRLTKSGLLTLTHNLAIELAPRIQVNALALGAILPPPGKGQDHLDRIANERVPLKRGGSAEIVAENVLHLLRSPFTTGAVIPLDGGEFL